MRSFRSVHALPLTLALLPGCIVLIDPEGDTDTTEGDTGGSADSGADDPSATSDGSDGSEGSDGGSDTGVVPTERAVDIVFVVDNSGSMGEEQAKLVQGVDALVNALDGAVPPVDYRIAVTTTDNGNPWCQTTTPEAGTFRGTSCRSRSSDFVFEGATVIDSTEEACLSVCDQENLGLSVPWIDVARSTGTTNAPGGDVASALHCLLPQGINGCGFEQPLESLSMALLRAESPGNPNAGFLRPGALLAVVLVTDEVDCSTNPSHDTVFLPDGNRVFWSDPGTPAPSSAVCWNAGVQCTGTSPYDDCLPVNLDEDGSPVAGDPEIEAVMRPLAGYVEELSDRGAYVMAINGVGPGGSVIYADSLEDPQFQEDFGIGPGCSSLSGRAVPPVRIRHLVQSVSGPGNLHSICDQDFGPAFASMAAGILSRLP
ncbi:MAG: VWA domain-containing protein [Myxococcales bacterium]|nr:VWA domain-containing protein [Myxococcales bacterium]MCB9714402.1 VWA domain-containing protein [Myxococcales bacterium]